MIAIVIMVKEMKGVRWNCSNQVFKAKEGRKDGVPALPCIWFADE
jgi:hypothetical protein